VICPACDRPIPEHGLEESWECLDAVGQAAAELAHRACGGAAPAALERELTRHSPNWRTTRVPR